MILVVNVRGGGRIELLLFSCYETHQCLRMDLYVGFELFRRRGFGIAGAATGKHLMDNGILVHVPSSQELQLYRG